MIWNNTNKSIPPSGQWVIVRVINSDGNESIYQAHHEIDEDSGFWFLDQDYWPKSRKKKEGFLVTHWTLMPEL